MKVLVCAISDSKATMAPVVLADSHRAVASAILAFDLESSGNGKSCCDVSTVIEVDAIYLFLLPSGCMLVSAGLVTT